MALINCPDCGKEVSDSAKNCIHCGCVLKQSLINCPECGNEVSDSAASCPKCGFALRKEDTAQKVVVLKESKATGKKLLMSGLTMSLVVSVIALIFHFIALSFGITFDGVHYSKSEFFARADLGLQIIFFISYICRFLSLGSNVFLLAKPKFRKKIWIIASVALNALSLVHLICFDITTEELGCFIILLPVIILVALLLQIFSLFIKDEE